MSKRSHTEQQTPLDKIKANLTKLSDTDKSKRKIVLVSTGSMLIVVISFNLHNS